MKKIYTLILTMLLSMNSWAKPQEILFWHAMAGHLGQEVNALAEQFNQSQQHYRIKPVYKGDYIETLTSFAAAFRAHKPPAMVQIFEVGTGTMLTPVGAIKPVSELLEEQNISLPQKDFIPVVKGFYSKEGKLMSMPFNLSVPVIYYNADLLQSLGYTSDNFPKTWDDLELLAKRLKSKGYSCTYTTAYPAWILVESFLAIHGLPLLNSKNHEVAYNNSVLLTQLKRLKKWQNEGYFRFGGRIDDATVLFSSGICPLFSQSSGAYNSLNDMVNFRLGIAPLPWDENLSDLRHPDVFGGASIWVVAGQSLSVEQGIAQFFQFLSQPETQKSWQKNTGYIPIGLTGVYAKMAQENLHPTLILAQKDLQVEKKSTVTPPYGPLNQIRGVNDEALEAIFSGLKTPEKALEDAESEANFLIYRFKKITKTR